MGSQAVYYGRRVLTEAWLRLGPNYSVRVGSQTVRIPGRYREAARLARDWQDNWKTAVLRKCLQERDGCFIDVGTNIGDTLLDYLQTRRAGQRYIGFEPNPLSSQMLASVIAASSVTAAIVLPVGLADRACAVELLTHAGHPDDESASMIRGLRPGRQYDSQWIACVKFDDVRNDLQVDKIALIKIDVEGAEGLVLKGMADTLRQLRTWVLCEVLHRDSAADEDLYRSSIDSVMETLREARYSMLRIDRSSVASPISFTRCENLPQRVYSAESEHLCDYMFVPEEDIASFAT